MTELKFSSCDDCPEFKTGLEGILETVSGDADSRSIFGLGGRVVDFVESLLKQIDLPPRDVVLDGVSKMLDRAFAVIDFPGPDILIERAIETVVLAMVGRIYDRLASE